jgi:hypothetical protein
VDVGIKVLRHVVVYNVRNSLHVDTASCNISRDKDTVTTVLKSVKRLLPLSLRKVAVQRRYVLTTTSKLLSETLSGMFHLREHNDESLTILLQPVREDSRLRLLSYLIHRVRNGCVSILNLNLNQRRVVKDAVRQITDLFRHSCREEKRLTLSRDLRDDLLDIREESHVTHAICLIKDEVLDPLEIDRATTDMIEETPRACYDNLRLSTEIRDLTTVRHTAVNSYALDARTRSERLNYVINLLCKLSSRSEDESLSALFLRSTELL